MEPEIETNQTYCPHCQKGVTSRFFQVHEYSCANRKYRKPGQRQEASKQEMIPCSECGESFPFNVFALHYEQCPALRSLQCGFCNNMFPSNLMLQHFEICQSRENVGLQRIQMNQVRRQTVQHDLYSRINIMHRMNNLQLDELDGIFRNHRSRRRTSNQNGRFQILLGAHLEADEDYGLNQNDIKMIKRSKATKQDGNCAICYSELKDNEKIFSLNCRHKFHEQCLKPWLYEHRHCPLCRKNVLTRQLIITKPK